MAHREEEFDPAGFDVLFAMQAGHFWYLGRHRFLYRAFLRAVRTARQADLRLKAVDLGGGCGGWVKYLVDRGPHFFREVALGDSSSRCLELAGTVLDHRIDRYQVDLLQLGWTDRWDVVFLLDVLEHIPDDREVLRQIRDSLRPGGLLFVTAPALKCFWSANDVLSQHVRRYARRDFRRLARQSGLELYDARYFMFFLSPLLWLARRRAPDHARMSPEQIQDYLKQTHRAPPGPINQLLRLIFALETPLGLWLPFPWGASILGVFRKPQ